MAHRRAEILTDKQLSQLLLWLDTSSTRPLVDKAAFLLSYKAGLRVQEIAGLQWESGLLDATGGFRVEPFLVPGANGRPKTDQRHVLFIGDDIGKNSSERTIPLNATLLKALQALRSAGLPGPWVIPSAASWGNQELKAKAHALKVRLNRIYDQIEVPDVTSPADLTSFRKCSSHSGRRTFITNAARKANLANCSIVDVQKLAGHRNLTTTQSYVEVTSAQADLVDLI